MTKNKSAQWYVEPLDQHTFQVVDKLLREVGENLESVNCRSFPDKKNRNNMILIWEVNLRIILNMRDKMKGLKYHAWLVDGDETTYCSFYDPIGEEPLFRSDKYRRTHQE